VACGRGKPSVEILLSFSLFLFLSFLFFSKKMEKGHVSIDIHFREAQEVIGRKGSYTVCAHIFDQTSTTHHRDSMRIREIISFLESHSSFQSKSHWMIRWMIKGLGNPLLPVCFPFPYDPGLHPLFPLFPLLPLRCMCFDYHGMALHGLCRGGIQSSSLSMKGYAHPSINPSDAPHSLTHSLHALRMWHWEERAALERKGIRDVDWVLPFQNMEDGVVTCRCRES
jgi:hypothetical protein